MIVIGSHALALRDIQLRDTVGDLDLIGDRDDVARFRARHAGAIVSESESHGHRVTFAMAAGFPFPKVEFDFEQSPSDLMLATLCVDSVPLLGESVGLPSVEALFLIKRAHANVPVHYDKTIRDLVALGGRLRPFTSDELEFLATRKRECQDRYRLKRQRFSLSVRNEDFFALSDHVRVYVHDDLHEVLAFEPGAPLYKRCKRDLTLAKIDVDLFEALSARDRLRMVQEEFTVIGVERFYLGDRSLDRTQVYERGMHKTIRDLFVGYFQDFCIDHIGELLEPPPHDFLGAFEAAEREGRLRKVELVAPPLTEAHRAAWKLIVAGRLGEARRISEDLARRGPVGGDPNAFFLLGVIFYREGNARAAEQWLLRCLARDRGNASASYQLGLLYCRLKRFREAAPMLWRTISLGTQSYGAFFSLGQALEAEGSTRLAIEAYRKALARKPQSEEARAKIAALAPDGGTAGAPAEGAARTPGAGPAPEAGPMRVSAAPSG